MESTFTENFSPECLDFLQRRNVFSLQNKEPAPGDEN